MPVRLFRTLLVLLFICHALHTRAQDKHVMDSLKHLVRTVKHDTLKAKSLYSIAEKFIGFKQADSSLVYIEKSLAIVNKNLPGAQGAEKKAYLNLKALDLYAKAATIDNVAKDEEFEKLFIEARDIYLVTGAQRGLADLCRRMGSFYRRTNRYDEAIEVLEKSLKIYESLKLRLNVSQCYMFMADTWRDKGQYNISIEYYNKAIVLKEELKDYKSLSVAYTNLGLFTIKKETLQSPSIVHTKRLRSVKRSMTKRVWESFISILVIFSLSRAILHVHWKTLAKPLKLAKKSMIKKALPVPVCIMVFITRSKNKTTKRLLITTAHYKFAKK